MSGTHNKSVNQIITACHKIYFIVLLLRIYNRRTIYWNNIYYVFEKIGE